MRSIPTPHIFKQDQRTDYRSPQPEPRINIPMRSLGTLVQSAICKWPRHLSNLQPQSYKKMKIAAELIDQIIKQIFK